MSEIIDKESGKVRAGTLKLSDDTPEARVIFVRKVYTILALAAMFQFILMIAIYNLKSAREALDINPLSLVYAFAPFFALVFLLAWLGIEYRHSSPANIFILVLLVITISVAFAALALLQDWFNILLAPIHPGISSPFTFDGRFIVRVCAILLMVDAGVVLYSLRPRGDFNGSAPYLFVTLLNMKAAVTVHMLNAKMMNECLNEELQNWMMSLVVATFCSCFMIWLTIRDFKKFTSRDYVAAALTIAIGL